MNKTLIPFKILFVLLLAPGCTHGLFKIEELQGTWTSPCLPTPHDVGYSQNSMTEVDTFSGDQITILDIYYTDGACMQPYYSQAFVGKTSVGASAINPPKARTIDMPTATITVVANTNKAVDDFNLQALCGFEDWVIGTDRNVTGMQCTDDENQTYLKQGDSIFQVVEVDDQKTLYWGALPNQYNTKIRIRPNTLSQAPYSKH